MNEYEDEQPQQPVIKPSSPYQNPMQQFGSSIITMTNPENDIDKLELSLKNMVLDEEGNPIQIGEPLLNDIGVSSVIGQVQSLSNQISVMSNFEKGDIVNIIMLDFCDTLIKDLMLNRINYNIKYYRSTRDKILTMSKNYAYVTLLRALYGGERGFWKGSLQEFKSSIDNTGTKRKGMLSLFNPWSK